MNNLIKINSVEHLTAMIKAIVPRSFEKTFGGLSTDEVVAGFMFCVAGFSQTELNIGLDKIKQMGYCPDPAMFAKWCKGIDSFDNSDRIADSYIGKSGALANILLWLKDNKTQITKAQKQAYDKTAHLFYDIKYNPKLELTAHLAFMDNYEQIVRELVANKIICEVYTPPIAIDTPKQKVNAKSTDSANHATARHYINELFGQLGMQNKIKTQGV